MTTTTSSTSTASTTNSSSSTSSTFNGSSIVQSLGAGSGIDTAALVDSLVQASFAAKNATLKTKEDTLTTQISSIAQLQSDITGFASSLDSLVKGGTLDAQPTSTNGSVLTATALAGAKLANLSATVEVDRLATAQSAISTATFASRTATVGTGTLTITLGSATVANGTMSAFTAGSAAAIKVTIDSSNNTLDGIAKAINLAKAGVTASVITDVDGTARLSIKGTTGSANAFTVAGDSVELQQFDVGTGASGTSITSAAGNAQLKLDGVAVERASNTVSDLIDGVQLNLASASVGNPVTLGSTQPTAAIKQAMSDFVTTYNQIQTELKTQLDPITGPLKNDTATNALWQSLRGLTLLPMLRGQPTGTPTTLAELGVATNRDGSLSLDTAQLSTAMTNYPDAVEAMFSTGVLSSGDGLNAAFQSISLGAQSSLYGLAASTKTYTASKATVTDAETQATTDAATMKTRLTQQFAAMDSKVAAYKSTQTFLTAQIAAWNAQSSS